MYTRTSTDLVYKDYTDDVDSRLSEYEIPTSSLPESIK